MWNKWKNHFPEEGDVGLDVGVLPHEKESEQEDAYTIRKIIQPHPYNIIFLLTTNSIYYSLMLRK